MTSKRRVASAAAVLALLALNLGCPFGPPSDPVPETDVCEGAPREAAIDGVEATASFLVGAQGASMVAVSVDWVGGDAPACANVDIRLQEVDGTRIRSVALAMETEPSDRGRRSASPHFFVLDDPPCEARVEVDSYGRTHRVYLVDTESFRCPTDAGAPLDAGR